MREKSAEIGGDEARHRLYDVMRRGGSFEEKANRALEAGMQYLGVENGHVARVDTGENQWEVVASTDPESGDFPPGLTLDLEETYCRRTIAEESSVTLHDAPEQGWVNDPAFEAHGLHCYLGITITVEGDTYGTVCFVAENPRSKPFTDGETMFAELVARMLGRAKERERHEERLAVRERELDRRSEQVRSLVRAGFDGSFRLDTDGTISQVSDASTDLLDVEWDELTGEQWGGTLVPEDRTTKLIETALDGRVAEASGLPVPRDGKAMYVDVRLAPIHDVDDDGRTVAGIQGTIRNATERRRRDRLIDVLHRVLRHNLRNDMNVVRGWAEELDDRVDDEKTAMVEQIHTTASELIHLGETAQALHATVGRKCTPRPTPVESLVTPVVEEVRGAYPRATVGLDLDDPGANVLAPPDFDRALLELVDNAAKHAGDDPTVEVATRTTDDAVRVRVSDDGPGLPTHERKVLREGIETALEHGNGLGLWLVRWIVTTCDGTVDVDVSGGGTTVTVALSRSPDAG